MPVRILSLLKRRILSLLKGRILSLPKGQLCVREYHKNYVTPAMQIVQVFTFTMTWRLWQSLARVDTLFR